MKHVGGEHTYEQNREPTIVHTLLELIAVHGVVLVVVSEYSQWA